MSLADFVSKLAMCLRKTMHVQYYEADVFYGSCEMIRNLLCILHALRWC